jgi:hypothetical protein
MNREKEAAFLCPISETGDPTTLQPGQAKRSSGGRRFQKLHSVLE